MNDGGSAFPNTHVHPERIGQINDEDRIREGWYGQGGMSLRDYFAAKAMQGAISTCGEDASYKGIASTGDEISIMAYAIADAMLEARNKKEKG